MTPLPSLPPPAAGFLGAAIPLLKLLLSSELPPPLLTHLTTTPLGSISPFPSFTSHVWQSATCS